MSEVRTAPEIFDVSGRTAVVTGASSGIGERAALVLAAGGARVVAVARRQERLDDLARRDSRVVCVTGDVGVPGDRARAIEAAGGAVDVLVNNAATGGSVSTDDEDADAFAEVLGLNLVAAYDLSRRAAAVAGREGLSIINVASVLGIVTGAPVGGAAYAASKAGLLGLTRELAGQWARRSVRCNALVPGWFRTEMTAELFADESATAWVHRNTLLRRSGDVAELDGALLFLASGASSFCTGQSIVVDGGWTAR
ncbi:SDR family NAD(P)-dependent oxidoreductase [Nocardioides litoris]|uniref:SDR family NAD(P)-dependent oxidoreductase n=1 Tax=Nocardioides litoris TaxID=1926648 RepID=UPI00111F4041|nr:SDR family oxidoreductase [Nocardioides litoris]